MGVGVAIVCRPHKFDRGATSESAAKTTSCAMQMGVRRSPATALRSCLSPRWRDPQLNGFNLGRRPVHGTSIIRAEDFEN